MQACTFISKILLLAMLAFAGNAQAQMEMPGMPNGAGGPAGAPAGGPGPGGGAEVPPPKKEDPGIFDQSTPYLEYGDFSMNEDDDADTMYFQYGRFFGLSLGLGYQNATGNRSLLYTPAFPRFDLKVHYWFDFQLALNIGIFFASHSYEFSGTTTNVRLIGYGVDLKYSFDVRNTAAPISFSNPFLVVGVGSISKTEATINATEVDMDSTFSVNFGAGLEFPIVFKKTYFIIDARYHTQNFIDTNDTRFNSRDIPDLTGGFFTTSANILFSW
jgi:hypothetical protein